MVELSWYELPDLTGLIRLSQHGDKDAEGRLFHAIYPMLRSVARRLVRGTACPHELVHDVYVGRLQSWRGPITDRSHYLALVTTAMKNELVDRARKAKAVKRTAPVEHENVMTRGAAALSYEEILGLERELEHIEKEDPRAAQVVRMRYYGGCSWEETAAAVGSTVRLVRTDWDFAAGWLRERLG